MSTFRNIKNIGVIISTVAALKKAISDTMQQQERAIFRKKQQKKKRKRNERIVAGVLGGVVLGAIVAIFTTSESTKERVTGLFSNGQHDYDEDAIIREASQKAEALAERAKRDSQNN